MEKDKFTDIDDIINKLNLNKDKVSPENILNIIIENPVWLSVSEASKLGGVQSKTIRRALKSNSIKFKIISNRYFIDFTSLVKYLLSNTKLRNKLNQSGIGQYIKLFER